jgi:hypothetical protein
MPRQLLCIIQQREHSTHTEQEESVTIFQHFVFRVEFCPEQLKFLKTESIDSYQNLDEGQFL